MQSMTTKSNKDFRNDPGFYWFLPTFAFTRSDKHCLIVFAVLGWKPGCFSSAALLSNGAKILLTCREGMTFSCLGDGYDRLACNVTAVWIVGGALERHRFLLQWELKRTSLVKLRSVSSSVCLKTFGQASGTNVLYQLY